MTYDLAWGDIWPARDIFCKMATTHKVLPIVKKLLVDDTSPIGIYRLLSKSLPGTFLLESAEQDGLTSRWSYVGVRSSASLTSKDGKAQWIGDVPKGILRSGSTIDLLASVLGVLKTESFSHLPPFTGGLVGAIGWEIISEWEPSVRAHGRKDIDLPDVSLNLVDDLVAIDHKENAVWLIANTINHMDEVDPDLLNQRYDDALMRISQMSAGLVEPDTLHISESGVPQEESVTHIFPQEDFEDTVVRSKKHIVDGDVFQVVISQRLDVECQADPLDVYRVLRTINPSPYMYYLQLHDPDRNEEFSVVGASPETLVKVVDRDIMTFPIAGSRPRGKNYSDDQRLADELVKDPKERSEHIMLVDLARNDLAKVAIPGSVSVDELMAIKRFSHIMHITSTVTAKLSECKTALDCLMATFPAGTLSGAPKPRAIQIIDECEPVRRGFYGGVVGYFDFSGNADFAIAIRTAVIEGKTAHIQAGAGIVADSDPYTEYVETRNKGAAVVRAVNLASSLK
ncbi:chorismate-binding protein [Arcanobacterium ihumii]|uniref:chorismate-binding protein n=1 Tax=Arcanobacterium ihumii TaxID=2138162 RepID=UPI00190F87C2|nr:chorismate-binding protein [Arcanobacterium ihumii]